MFTKEKLEKWIEELKMIIFMKDLDINQIKRRNDPKGHLTIAEIEKSRDNLLELKTTLEQIYISMTSDNSI